MTTFCIGFRLVQYCQHLHFNDFESLELKYASRLAKVKIRLTPFPPTPYRHGNSFVKQADCADV
jgi:hypothetical protein